ncbi:hypothetical protein [Streptomyces axinellae]|uniref:Transposase n=1 Tax=Streptomyces axinellae TaxID=552788 RepID=A0ABP6D6U1_9ACTN
MKLKTTIINQGKEVAELCQLVTRLAFVNAFLIRQRAAPAGPAAASDADNVVPVGPPSQ